MTDAAQSPPDPATSSLVEGRGFRKQVQGAGGRPFRVAYLINQYPQPSQSFIRREIAALEELGVEVRRYSLRRPGSDAPDPADRIEAAKTLAILDSGALRILRSLVRTSRRRPLRLLRALRMALALSRRRMSDRLLPLVYLAEACHLLDLIEADPVDHLHAHFGTNSAAVALLLRILGGPTYSFTVHGPEEFDRPEELALGEKVAYASAVVAVSSFGRSQLYRWCRWQDWNKVEVVRCGVDAAFLQAELRPLPEEPLLVSIARLSPEKGQLLLLRAAASLSKSGLQFGLRIIGDGPLRGFLHDEAARLGISDSVSFLGWQDGSSVRAAIQGARALVVPSFAEGLPVVAMEALALGRPVVATCIAGIPELVSDGESGWLVPAGSVSELAGAMKAALLSPLDRLERMGRSGAGRVRSHHDCGKEAQKLLAIFQRSLA